MSHESQDAEAIGVFLNRKLCPLPTIESKSPKATMRNRAKFTVLLLLCRAITSFCSMLTVMFFFLDIPPMIQKHRKLE